MKSIGRKILRITLFSLIIIVILLTSVSIIVVNKISDNDSKILLTSLCEKETLRFNNEFKLMENSVTTIAKYIQELEEECTSEQEMLSDEFCQKVQYMTLSIANRTDGAMSVYFRYNPELTGSGKKGFFFSRDNNDDNFSFLEPTDILEYDQNDTEHVGWFYEPKRMHAALWMNPYYNKNLNVFMISYIIPYYTKSGNFLGVIGMDIDFNKIILRTGEVNLYKTGKINLVDLSTYYIYGLDESKNVVHSNLSLSLYNHITTIDKEKRTLTITDNKGTSFLTCVDRLANGMRLILSVPEKEINRQRNNMLKLFAVIMLITLSVTIFLIIRLTKKIVEPLTKLTEITEEYAKGNWNEIFISQTDDEIQKLSESISVMAEDANLQEYLKQAGTNPESVEKGITTYLTSLKNGLGYKMMFAVCNASGAYYTCDGISSYIDKNYTGNSQWYGDFINSGKDWDLNVDIEESTNWALSVFINQLIKDEYKNIIGVCGTAVEMTQLQSLLKRYERIYQVKIDITDNKGLIQIDTDENKIKNEYINLPASSLISDGEYYFEKLEEGSRVLTYMKDINMYLVVTEN